MTLTTLRSLASLSTALSLALALVVSVFAQSHASSPSAIKMDQPCADHHAPVSATNWADACASLCESADFHMVLNATGERSEDLDLKILPVSYSAPTMPALVRSRISGALHGHDPPGSHLYLTTGRLRL